MKFDLESYNEWRHAHPTQPLHRDVESWMVLEIVQLREEVEAERAAVVTFVRGARLDELADAVERGEHRREEKS